MDKISMIKQSENETLLTEYTSILLRNIEEGVATNDLNQVQQDLKKLQWTMRTRFFQGEYSEARQMDAHQDKNGFPTHMLQPSLKRKRSDDTSICRDIKNDLRLIKRDLGYHEKKEIVELTLPRDDKFPCSVEPYCAPVNKTNVAFLDALIQETARNADKKVAENAERLTNDGEHVTKSLRYSSDSKRNGLHIMVESFGSVTQKLLSALIQDKPVNSNDKVANVTNTAESGAKANKMKNRNSLDRMLLKELVDQGILLPEDIHKDIPEDENLAEVKKSHS